jgi:lipopolysaccharide transport system permease protein
MTTEEIAPSDAQVRPSGARNTEVLVTGSPGVEPAAADPRRELQTPVVVIEARHGWRGLGLAELWSHRELMYFFVWRDLKVRYRQTVFGASWAVMQPVLLMLVFTATVGRIAGVGPAGIPYPLFAFAGLVPWTLFASSLSSASNSLVNAEGIITKVYFPRLLLPFAAVGSFLIDFLVAMVVLGLLMWYFGVTPSIAVLWLPLFTLFALITALGVGTWLAAINVRYRDVKYVVPFLTQTWMFASPVIYATTLIPKDWQWLFALNPMTGVLDGFRWALIGGPRPDELILVSAAASVLVFASALVYFRRTEQTFADVI